MFLRVAVRWTTVPLVAVAAALACAGKSGGKGPDAGGCLDFELSHLDLTCGTDEDCIFLPTGIMCSLPCCLQNPTAGNMTAAARFEIQTAEVPYSGCASGETCPGLPGITCDNGICVVCGAGGCVDGGTGEDGG